MGRKQAQALLAALIASPVAAQDNLLVNGGFQQGLSGWYETGPGGVYDGCGPAGGYCYVFSYATGIVQQTVTAQANYTGFIVGFEYRLPCNNSIGGYCTNPNGPVDWLTANLNLYLGDIQVQSVPLLSVQSYQPNYAVFSLTGTAPEFNTATITFSGQDVGFWAGPYGPQIDRVSLSFENPPPPPPPPPEPEPEPEPEPVVVPPAAIDPAPDVAPDPTQEVLQNEPVQEEVVVEEPVVEAVSEAVEEAVPEEVIVSDDLVEPQDEDQAEDANDTPLSPDQLQALSAVEQPSAPTDEEVAQATEAVAQEAEAAEAARVEQAAPEQTITVEVRRDRNVDFFQREAVEDADTFSRETVLQVSAQNIASLMQADIQDAQTYGEQTTTEITGEGYYFGIVDGPTFLPPPTTGMAERVEDTSVKEAFAEETFGGTAPVQEVVSAPQAEQAPVASLAVGVDVSPAGQAQQMEILNMAGMQGDMSAGPVIDVGDVNTGDSEAMTQLAVVPAGYSSYTQARIPDAPFYQPRDIYKNRRIPDANLALYRMMQGQDQRWNEMVEDQYE